MSFYQWSTVFFVFTYLVNHTRTFSTLFSSSPSSRRRYPRQPFGHRSPPAIITSQTSIDPTTIEQPGWSSLRLDQETIVGGKRIKVGVATCASSRNWEHLGFTSMSLTKLMLPSLLKTMEADRFNYVLFVGIDDTDSFWNTPANQERLRSIANEKNLEVQFHSFPQPKSGHRIPLNDICQVAYDAGSEYIVRINDDTEFVTPYWSSLGIKKLRSFGPPDVGVVGPTCRQGNLEILTHDMVNRKHLDIFGTYYPPDFRNWYVDDWISLVYGRERTRVLGKWEVKHHIGYHGTRYESHVPNLEGAVQTGKRKLEDWLRLNNNEK